MNERWMKDIQDRFADFEKPAPEGLLADVQREMQRRGLSPVEEKRRKLVPMWVKGAAVAASLAVVLGVGTLLLTNNEEVVNNYDVQAVVNEQPDLETQPETQTQIYIIRLTCWQNKSKPNQLLLKPTKRLFLW